jgi:hypothetical protein
MVRLDHDDFRDAATLSSLARVAGWTRRRFALGSAISSRQAQLLMTRLASSS